MNRQEEAQTKACCADLYQSGVARLIFGDALHPGGLALTHRLGKLMDIRPDELVVDLASGRGASALAVSRGFRCRVVGLEFGSEAMVQARATALESPTAARTFFLQGDAEWAPLQTGRFDAAFCECSMSLFVDKIKAAQEIGRLLRPGGRLGLSDVTVDPGSLPPELQGPLGQILCLADALRLQGYINLMESAGLQVVLLEDASAEIIRVLDGVDAKVGALTAWQGLIGQAAAETDTLRQVPPMIAQVRALVEAGQIGYWLLVAEKPG